MGKILSQDLIEGKGAVVGSPQLAVLIKNDGTGKIDVYPISDAMDISQSNADKSQACRHVEVDDVIGDRSGKGKVLDTQGELAFRRLAEFAVEIDKQIERSSDHQPELCRFKLGRLKLRRLELGGFDRQAQAVIAVHRKGVSVQTEQFAIVAVDITLIQQSFTGQVSHIEQGLT